MKRFHLLLPPDIEAGIRALGIPWSEAIRTLLREALRARGGK